MNDPLVMTELDALSSGMRTVAADMAVLAPIAAKAANEVYALRREIDSLRAFNERLLAERNATYDAHTLGKLANELDEDNYASAAKAMREAIFMLDNAAKRDAAWARLVAAHVNMAHEAEWQNSLKEPRAEIAAAEQALRDLGVDTDTLLDSVIGSD